MSEKVGTHPTAPPPDKKELASQFSRVPRRYRSIVRAVNALEPQMRKLTDEELAAIRDAAAAAETGTAAEVVAVIVDRCDAYADALWKAAALGGLGGALSGGSFELFDV